MRIQLVGDQRAEGGHHAAHHACRHPTVQSREEQAATASAGETERSQAPGIGATFRCQNAECNQVVVQHGTGERLAQRTGGLGQCVLMQRRRKIKAFVIGGTDPLLPPERALGLQ